MHYERGGEAFGRVTSLGMITWAGWPTLRSENLAFIVAVKMSGIDYLDLINPNSQIRF